MISLTSMHLSRLELRESVSRSDMAYAKCLAQSSVEFALGRMSYYSNWRTRYAHDETISVSPPDSDATLSYRLLDEDGDLADDVDDPVEIQGIGRFGTATYLHSVTCANRNTQTKNLGPQEVKSYDEGYSTSAPISNSNYLGQYFKPVLPPDALDWRVSSVEVYAGNQSLAIRVLGVKLYAADSSGMPTEQLDSDNVVLVALTGHAWRTATFENHSGLDPEGGYCIGLEGDSGNTAADIRYHTSVSQTNAHLLRGGNNVWWSSEPTQSLLYRVYGEYTTIDGDVNEFQIEPGSWKRVAAP
ncbi:hypothetical protein [Adhaeretor mobilis]|nr:hypothetical protein [Adhaeretor mobilis]